jgi:hypothetical protein
MNGPLMLNGHELIMPYPGCSNLIQSVLLGQNVNIPDEPCREKLREAIQFSKERPHPEVPSGVTEDGTRPEDKLPPDSESNQN